MKYEEEVEDSKWRTCTWSKVVAYVVVLDPKSFKLYIYIYIYIYIFNVNSVNVFIKINK